MKAAALILLLACCGCNTTRFSRTEVWNDPARGTVTNTVTASNSRFIWSTMSFTANLKRDSASLSAAKSKSDAETIAVLAQALVSLAAKAP